MPRLKKPFEDSPQAAMDAAVGLLARREQSPRELRQKLTRKGYSAEVLDQALETLAERDWLSESRYAAFIARHRATQGRGPRWVRSELRGQAIEDAEIEVAMHGQEIDWSAACIHAFQRMRRDDSVKDQARCRQKLYLRGFEAQQIDDAIKNLPSCTD